MKGGLKTWKRGLAPIISATMAPNDQMSIGVEYLAQPSRISGALAKELGQCWTLLIREWVNIDETEFLIIIC